MLFVITAALLASAYICRLADLSLQVIEHPKTFVSSNGVSACACIYTAVQFWTNGIGVLEVLVLVMSMLHLLRSHETYVRVTRPGELGPPVERSFGG